MIDLYRKNALRTDQRFARRLVAAACPHGHVSRSRRRTCSGASAAPSGAPAGTSESSVCASTGVVSQVLVRQEHGSETWQVWIGLDDEDPIEGPGFIIGLAATRDEAVAEAVADLQAAVATLQGPFLAPGTPDAQD